MRVVLIFFCLFVCSDEGFSQKLASKKDQQVSIAVEGGALMGSFLVPKSKSPIPVVLLIPGSGPTDRNCNSQLGLISNTFLMLAEELYKANIATLRIDKRTSGESVKTFSEESLKLILFDDFIHDVEVWIDSLKNDPRFSDVIVAGHSQGSLVGMIATKNKQADKFISLSGAGRSIDNIMCDQFDASFPNYSDTTRKFFDGIKNGIYLESTPHIIKQNIPRTAIPFFQSWIKYNPEEEIRKLNVPILVVNGEHDIQVAVSEAELLHASSPQSKLVLIPEMSHILKNAPADRLSNMMTYNQPELPLNIQLVEEVIRFVNQK